MLLKGRLGKNCFGGYEHKSTYTQKSHHHAELLHMRGDAFNVFLHWLTCISLDAYPHYLISNWFCVFISDVMYCFFLLLTNMENTYIFHINNNAWVTVNNDFGLTSEAICQIFSRVTKSRVKTIGKSHHEWPKKSLFTVKNVLFHFLHAILCPEHTIRSLISQLSPRTVVSDLALWRQHSGSVTSRETCIVTSYLSIVLARANWRKGDLH